MVDVDLSKFALSIVVLGIVASIGAVIMLGVRDSSDPVIEAVKLNLTTATYNNTIADIHGFVNPCSALQNGTESVKFWNGTAVDYNINAARGTLEILEQGQDVQAGGGISFNITNHYKCTADYNLSNNAALGLGEYGNWFSILVIVSIAAVIIGLIMLAFRPTGGQAIGSALY